MKAMAIFGAVTGVLVMALGVSFLFSFPLWLAWNHVMPYLFGLKEITWLQAWCLTIIGSAIIKSSIKEGQHGQTK